jgi:hypothetical protein
MKRFYVILIGLIFIFQREVEAQSEVDAFRIGHFQTSGTARFNAMSGAFGALGGDISTASINPAGLGVFRKSEIAYTPELNVVFSNSHFNQTSSFDVATERNNNSVGLVWHIQKDEEKTSGWLCVNLGVTYNQQKDFKQNTIIQGANEGVSRIDRYVYDLNQYGGENPANINNNPYYYQGVNLAWQTYLIEYNPFLENPYYRNFKKDDNTIEQVKEEDGHLAETAFTFSTNYNNKWYLGANIGIVRADYYQKTRYKEEANSLDTATLFQNFTLNELLSTRGRGINGKLGIIYRINNNFRAGFSYHLPTYFTLNDLWETSIHTNFEDESYSYEDPLGRFRYNVISPARFVLSGAAIIQKRMIVSVDYEWANYSSMIMKTPDDSYSFAFENYNIKNRLKVSNQLRLGAEWRLNNYFMRGGVGFAQNPWVSSDIKLLQQSFAGGLGYRDDTFFLDVAYQLLYSKSNYMMYNDVNLNPATIVTTRNILTLTLGVRF